MSDSARPHRQQPTRLPRPWDSPGKNTGVGFHFLLQCMQEKSEGEVAQSCLTLTDPMDYSLPGSSAHGIFQASLLEWGAIAFSGYMYTCDLFILRFNRKQQNSVKQLSFIKKRYIFFKWKDSYYQKHVQVIHLEKSIKQSGCLQHLFR